MPSSTPTATQAVKRTDTITLDDSDDDVQIVDRAPRVLTNGAAVVNGNGATSEAGSEAEDPEAAIAKEEADRKVMNENMWRVVKKIKDTVDQIRANLASQGRDADDDDEEDDDEEADGPDGSAKRKRGDKTGKPSRKKQKKDATDLPPMEFPPSGRITGGTLKDYQLTGVNWLCTRYLYAVPGAILADEMGTGKTLQTIALIAWILDGFYKPEAPETDKPFIVVLPKAVLRNWERELARFAPSIPVLVYAGTPPERAELRQRRLGLRGENNAPPFKRKQQMPVILVTYQILQRDVNFLSQLDYYAVVCDEAHQAKNRNSKNFAVIKRLKTGFRLLLTGTPLQNNLTELFTLLSFVFPRIFSDEESFLQMFDFTAVTSGTSLKLSEQEQTTLLAKTLTEMLSPFTLRRRKRDVVKNLPLKKEYVLHAPLTPLQKELLAAANIGPDALRAAIIGTGAAPSKLAALPSTTPSASASPAPNTPASEGSSPGASTPRKRTRGGRDRDIIDLSLLSDTHGPSSAGRKRRSRASTRSYSEAADAADDDDFEQQLVEKAAAEERRKEAAVMAKLKNGHSDGIAQRLKGHKYSSNLINHRFLALHPLLTFDDRKDRQRPPEDVIVLSGKMMLLDRLLAGLFARKSKVLIFSQFTRMMELFEEAFQLRGYDWYRIDGSNPADQDEIDEFNSSPYDPDGVNIFMLSTRSGGVGINLVGADTVILFDSDFNPQNDLQAMDRAHRIGQTKPVLVFRLVSEGTIEQAVLETATKKRKLERVVLGDDSLAGESKLPRKAAKGGKKKPSALAAEVAEKQAKEAALDRMLKEVWSVEGQKVRLAEGGDEVLSDKQLEQLLDRSDAAMQPGATPSALGSAALVFETNDAEEGEAGAPEKNEVADLLHELTGTAAGSSVAPSASVSATGSEAEDEDGEE
ncbi:Putative ATPase [Rhodotorula kratochvilovae]